MRSLGSGLLVPLVERKYFFAPLGGWKIGEAVEAAHGKGGRLRAGCRVRFVDIKHNVIWVEPAPIVEILHDEGQDLLAGTLTWGSNEV